MIIHYDYSNPHPCEKLSKPNSLSDEWTLNMSEWATIHLKEKTNVYKGHWCFISSPERTRPCRMLNNFHLCSCLPRLIVVLSPSTVGPTPSSYSAPCPCTHSCCDLIGKWLYADAYIAPSQKLYKQINTEKSQARSNLDWRTNKCLI